VRPVDIPCRVHPAPSLARNEVPRRTPLGTVVVASGAGQVRSALTMLNECETSP
jgi:hypothetical protein